MISSHGSGNRRVELLNKLDSAIVSEDGGGNLALATPKKSDMPQFSEHATIGVSAEEKGASKEALDLTKRFDLAFWGSLVVGFFMFFRKSDLLPDSEESYEPTKQLSHGAVHFEGAIAMLTITWSKTFQYRQREVRVPPFPIPDSALCPVSVLQALLSTKGRIIYLPRNRELPLLTSASRLSSKPHLRKQGMMRHCSAVTPCTEGGLSGPSGVEFLNP